MNNYNLYTLYNFFLKKNQCTNKRQIAGFLPVNDFLSNGDYRVFVLPVPVAC